MHYACAKIVLVREEGHMKNGAAAYFYNLDHKVLEGMKVGQNSVIVNDRFVVVRLSKKIYRLGELQGAWLMRGTIDEVLRRAA